jgi:broad specificity polyphosphatase/5'/3'-nucleotidase SurE
MPNEYPIFVPPLLTNDEGIDAPGLKTLGHITGQLVREVLVVLC